MSMLESPLARLNYFNGQRLEATDFRAEQDYHLRVRRWLNKSLYTYGIAGGLDVTVKEGDAHRVVVHPGLALDPEGREIILVDAAEVQVSGLPSVAGAVVLGNYLVIEYAEEKESELSEHCGGSASNGHTLSWGGPTRIRLAPEISLQNEWPSPEGGKILLAQLELDEKCAVREVHSHVRKYVGTSKATGVRALSLEGGEEIDAENSKQIYFHVRGGIPDAVTLYLRAAKFSTLFYKELGSHSHAVSINVVPDTDEGYKHKHTVTLPDLEAGDAGSGHNHVVRANVTNVSQNTLNLSQNTDPERTPLTDTTKVNLVVSEGSHSHTVTGGTFETDDPIGGGVQGYTASGTIAETGQSEPARSGGTPRTYVKNLRVFIDGTDPENEVTAEILDRLGWTQLGDGSSAHALATDGTGPIQLDLLGIDFFEGEHVIELKVDAGGGRILYNLYVD